MASDITSDQRYEIELLRRVAERDRQSFEELYDRFSSLLFSAALQVLNDQRDAEDVLQEVFLQIWDKAELYMPARGKPLAWALTLTRNKSIDRVRSTRRRYKLREEVELEAKVGEQISVKNSLDAVEASEKNRLVQSAVERLSKTQGEAIQLAFFSGLTQNEIAEELNEPIGTIKARIRRGMLKLREIIAPRL